MRIGVLLVLLGTMLPLTHGMAQEQQFQPAEACMAEIHGRLAYEQRLYRTVLFGQTNAERERPGATRFDQQGNAWIKNTENMWKTAARGFARAELDNDEMDVRSETPNRRGIFETRRVLTSELIPPLLQSIRALRCRIATICQNVRMSVESAGLSEGSVVTVKVPGCIAFDQPPLLSCQLAPENTQDTTHGDRGTEGFILGYCDSIGSHLLEREMDLLRLAASYDAAYRSLLQFAGNFDQFVAEFRVSLLTPIRQAVSLLGQLHRIPCFLAQCDE